MVGVTRLYLQGLEEAKGAQTSTSRHQAEGGVVEELLVIKPSKETNNYSTLICILNFTFQSIQTAQDVTENTMVTGIEGSVDDHVIFKKGSW